MGYKTAKRSFYLGTLLKFLTSADASGFFPRLGLRRAPGILLLAAAFFPMERAITIPVTVTVDFGPLGRARLVRFVRVWSGSTVVDALRKVSDVTQGTVCCDPRDVESIGGFRCDPKRQGWWLYEVNGAFGTVSARRMILGGGDQVRWFYVYRKVRSNSIRESAPAAQPASPNPPRPAP